MFTLATVTCLEILRFFSAIEIYIKMSEISNFWLSVLISQMPPYLMFILASKSTHPVSVVLSSQNAQCFYMSAQLWHAKTEKAFCQSLDSTIASIFFDAMNLKVIYRTDITMLAESTWE